MRVPAGAKSNELAVKTNFIRGSMRTYYGDRRSRKTVARFSTMLMLIIAGVMAPFAWLNYLNVPLTQYIYDVLSQSLGISSQSGDVIRLLVVAAVVIGLLGLARRKSRAIAAYALGALAIIVIVAQAWLIGLELPLVSTQTHLPVDATSGDGGITFAMLLLSAFAAVTYSGLQIHQQYLSINNELSHYAGATRA